MKLALTKWYIDVVTGDGRVAIAYWAALRIAGAEHAVTGVLFSRSGGPAERAMTLRSSLAPVWSGNHLSLHSPSLHLSVEAERMIGGFNQRLLETPAGVLDWHCEAPLARIRLATGDELLEGDGYVERIELGVVPWGLPIERLLWGRWIGLERTVVWIAWEGSHPLQLVWFDGALVAGAVASTTYVDLGSRGFLALDHQSVITDATIGEQLTSLAPLRAVVDRVAHYRQTRWRARGTFREPGRDDVQGWVIHEAVQWH